MSYGHSPLNDIPDYFPFACFRLSWHHRMNVQIESDTNVHKNIFEDDTCTSIQDGSSPKHPVRERKASSHNPWVLHCHRDNIARILGMDTEADSSQQLLLSLEKPASFEFIVLANLTWRYALFDSFVVRIIGHLRYFQEEASLCTGHQNGYSSVW